jgi:hypothetical protein
MSSRAEKVWAWLVLLTPTVESLLVSVWAHYFGRRFFLDDEWGPVSGAWWANLPYFLLLCLGLGIWWWDVPDWRDRIALGVLTSLGIAAANLIISLAGCAMTPIGN